MITTLLKAKLHRAHVTHSELGYEGSCAIDGWLLTNSGIVEYEQIHIFNVNNGARFITYSIRAEEGSGIISVNGAAARLAAPGDILIICAFSGYSKEELITYKPNLIYLNEFNEIIGAKNDIPIQS